MCWYDVEPLTPHADSNLWRQSASCQRIIIIIITFTTISSRPVAWQRLNDAGVSTNQRPRTCQRRPMTSLEVQIDADRCSGREWEFFIGCWSAPRIRRLSNDLSVTVGGLRIGLQSDKQPDWSSYRDGTDAENIRAENTGLNNAGTRPNREVIEECDYSLLTN